MREPSTRRDQREIVVPRDMRPARPETAAPRRAARAKAPAPGELWATITAFGQWFGGACLARPGEVLGSVAALAAVGYVTVNALGLQAGRHPAPILPQPAPALARSEPAAAARPPAAQVAAEPAPREKHAEKTPARDGIGEILRAPGDTTASVTPKGAAATPKPVDRVAQAQRALSKLGYGTLRADGVMGPATKAAIETFERDRKLPVTGEPAGRTLRELAAKAGASKG